MIETVVVVVGLLITTLVIAFVHPPSRDPRAARLRGVASGLRQRGYRDEASACRRVARRLERRSA